jgi:hypothetical protein
MAARHGESAIAAVTVPVDVVPSPQSMVAAKADAGSPALVSVKVATALLARATPTVAETDVDCPMKGEVPPVISCPVLIIPASSFDDLVDKRQNGRWDVEPERLGSFEIDYPIRIWLTAVPAGTGRHFWADESKERRSAVRACALPTGHLAGPTARMRQNG